VQGHYRTNPNYTNRDNYSTFPNINPYTGKRGTVQPDNKYTNNNSYKNYSNTSNISSLQSFPNSVESDKRIKASNSYWKENEENCRKHSDEENYNTLTGEKLTFSEKLQRKKDQQEMQKMLTDDSWMKKYELEDKLKELRKANQDPILSSLSDPWDDYGVNGKQNITELKKAIEKEERLFQEKK
jgi:hypothetical protein